MGATSTSERSRNQIRKKSRFGLRPVRKDELTHTFFVAQNSTRSRATWSELTLQVRTASLPSVYQPTIRTINPASPPAHLHLHPNTPHPTLSTTVRTVSRLLSERLFNALTHSNTLTHSLTRTTSCSSQTSQSTHIK